MLKAVGPGYADLEALTKDTVPASIRLSAPVTLPPAASESEALKQLAAIAAKNVVKTSFIGMGYYDCITPPVILRNILESPAWYTSYTPYQAEISQGRLESLLNFQTMVVDMTGMAISNASLLDEGTAAAEAMNLAFGQHNTKRTKFFVASDVHPQTIDVMRTRASGVDIEIVVGDAAKADFSNGDFFAVMLQYPNTYGSADASGVATIAASAAKSKTLTIMSTDLLSLTLLKSPGELGADIVVGSAQRLGVPMGFGGPHAAFLACRDEFKRRMPGRIMGVSIDAQGKRALRMALQTREQHIRRDKATSNICTAQALLANMAAMYAVYHGPEGLKQIASRIHTLAGTADSALRAAGYTVHGVSSAGAPSAVYFDTLRVGLRKGQTSAKVAAAAEAAGMNLRVIDGTTVGIAFDEAKTQDDLARLLAVFGAGAGADLPALARAVPSLPASAARTSAYLTLPVFNSHRSESQLLRYIYKLQSKDVSLAYSMISLGSCTMKLNATSEMIPITWPSFANMHPFVPPAQAAGYKEMIDGLSVDLSRITGFSAVSVQPNSGAAGEYAGLMAIRSYLRSIGQGQRNVCLIPVSAHGTNPASAVMAGMRVVVVGSDAMGNVDAADLATKAAANKDTLAALMVTYPSTYGVFEEGIKDAIDLVHGYGGQVYMDGANMNAQVGLTSPGSIGADVCHLNLHKTFCIPHGGGGPGVGAIGVASHLAPFLPGNPVIPTGGTGLPGVNVTAKSDLAVSAAPFGSALILPISWMYIRMLSEEGLRKSTQVAILNANYMAERLGKAYPVLYMGSKGRVAHEFILDLRPLKAATGGAVDEVDVAKRLMDFGFHAPTMSWPVSGTLMIEPTESEDKGELDRFCDALITIRAEIEDVITGKSDKVNNALKNAPHTATVVTADKWDRPYSRESAAYPGPHSAWLKDNKLWPGASRVDNVYGDRNLVCDCHPVSSYA